MNLTCTYIDTYMNKKKYSNHNQFSNLLISKSRDCNTEVSKNVRAAYSILKSHDKKTFMIR